MLPIAVQDSEASFEEVGSQVQHLNAMSVQSSMVNLEISRGGVPLEVSGDTKDQQEDYYESEDDRSDDSVTPE